MKRFFISMVIGSAVLTAGCAQQAEPEFAMRNAQIDADLQSIVRAQSNELLSQVQRLEGQAASNFASTRKLERALEETAQQVDRLQLNLPSLLAAQDVELATLRELIDEGAAEPSALPRKRDEIQAYRKALIASLDASLSRAASTRKALEATALRTQADRAADLTDDLTSARTTIAMQL